MSTSASKAAKKVVEARDVTAQDLAAQAVAETASHAVDAVNPQQVAGSPGGVEIQIDPQRLQQAVQVKNARLIASMVHENAALEVALEQERAARLEAEAKVAALQQLGDEE